MRLKENSQLDSVSKVLASLHRANTDDEIEDGLSSDIYDYDFYEEGNDSYIIINSEEYGKFTYSEADKEITIDQNQNSSVTLSDLYILKLTRKVIVTDIVIN